MRRLFIERLAVVFALALGGSLNAQASTTITDAATLQVNANWSYSEAGFTAQLPSGETLPSDGEVGIYNFSIISRVAGGLPGVPLAAGSFWSTCLSPGGVLDYSQHTYDLDSYAQASPGLNPNAWATDPHASTPPTDSQMWGIENAQYLWRKFGGGILAGGSNPDAGAGLALAMYDALYNSTGLGVVTTASLSTPFYVQNWGGHSGAQTAYNTDLLALNPTVVGNSLADGYMLVPDPVLNPGAGQAFIINLTPVPEPTTMLAGALLLLPFGASTLRFVRKNRAA